MSVQDVPGGTIDSLRIVDSGASMHKIGDILLRNIVISRRMLLPLMERERGKKERKKKNVVECRCKIRPDEERAKIWLLWFLIGFSEKNTMNDVQMPWCRLNIRTPLLKEKDKDLSLVQCGRPAGTKGF